jgi:hypothetical protein
MTTTSVANDPGTLNITLKKSSDFSAAIDFDITAVGVTATSNILSFVTGESVGSFATTVTDAAAGQITISMLPTSSASLSVGTYKWQHVWDYVGPSQKTMLTGFVEVIP